MRIAKHDERCVGSGQCVLTEPAVFSQDDNGVVLLLTDRPEGPAAEGARKAVFVCPTKSLSIMED
ncbi:MULTISPECIES: ferredoxin [unclassified Kitasatospora]|uniref:ferredoxin n=1 Tax=unclassified Kitasatospora TaxID=2633591 RepID=UPI0007095BA8|nr:MULTISPECIES: ferredoxin [unclassified Kitasatospora]KQV18696.1 ferredoxin [Kitasatospora sp. Root107]KRB74678.1 ferredoxin [Kitasatospora sp. Root187]